MVMGPQLCNGLQQRGLGLIEVLVALFIFSSAALGYAVLQSQAIGSTNYSMMRLQALMILNEASERIRANSQLQDLSIYQQYFNATGDLQAKNCLQNNGCGPEQVAQNDVLNLKHQAASQGFSLGMIDCPGVRGGVKPKCLIVAWRETTADYQTGISKNSKNSKQNNESTSCFTANGSVAAKADCVFIEIS